MLDEKEIDFIAEKKSHKIYVQVSYKLPSEETIDREFKPLFDVKDNYPKYVVTREEFPVNLYKPEETYYLYISKNVIAKNGLSLINKSRYEFTVK